MAGPPRPWIKTVSSDSVDILPTASLLIPLTVGCASLMTGLDQNVVITALPAIGRSLGEAPASLGLTLTAYLVF